MTTTMLRIGPYQRHILSFCVFVTSLPYVTETSQSIVFALMDIIMQGHVR